VLVEDGEEVDAHVVLDAAAVKDNVNTDGAASAGNVVISGGITQAVCQLTQASSKALGQQPASKDTQGQQQSAQATPELPLRMRIQHARRSGLRAAGRSGGSVCEAAQLPTVEEKGMLGGHMVLLPATCSMPPLQHHIGSCIE
jgi:hypothetical protein